MPNAPNVVIWLARGFACAAAIFIGLFALDAFGQGRSFWAALPDFLIHLLPTWILLATVAAAWRRPWIGAVVFFSLAALYTASTLRRPDWVLVIAGPLLLVAVLYFLSWWLPRTGHPAG